MDDADDGILNNGPHGSVYRFDSAAGDFGLVETSAWDDQDGRILDCLTSGGGGGGFSVAGGLLELGGQMIPVAGGGALTVEGAPDHDVVAVLSTSGFPGIPFLFSGGVDGQHFHQLFSKTDGVPIGPAVRLGVGGKNKGMVRICWSPEDRFVIYFQEPRGEDRIDLLCVVDVGDEVDRIAGDTP